MQQTQTGIKPKSLILIFTVFVVLQIAIGALAIVYSATSQTYNSLDAVGKRVKQDIVYNNGTWDTSRYDTDAQIPGPYRLYVLTKDGFVIDRWRPIDGHLDTSDFKQLQTYAKPQNVKTVTGHEWRMLSVPINSPSGKVVGLVAVGKLDPENQNLAEADGVLLEAAKHLKVGINADETGIDVSGVDILGLPYNVSFQVVDQFNKIHVKSGNSNSIDRLPNYIDPSYIVENLKAPFWKWVTDSKNSEMFMLKSEPIVDANGTAVGAVVVARSSNENFNTLRMYVHSAIVVAIIIVGAFSLFVYLLSKRGKDNEQSAPAPLSLEEVESIEFDKNNHQLIINDRNIGLTNGTNQYLMLQAMLAAPKKKWSADELLDKIGEDINRNGWRKLYDAMSSVNKKTAAAMVPKLITTSNKTYRVNTELILKIKKNSSKS